MAKSLLDEILDGISTIGNDAWNIASEPVHRSIDAYHRDGLGAALQQSLIPPPGLDDPSGPEAGIMGIFGNGLVNELDDSSQYAFGQPLIHSNGYQPINAGISQAEAAKAAAKQQEALAAKDKAHADLFDMLQGLMKSSDSMQQTPNKNVNQSDMFVAHGNDVMRGDDFGPFQQDKGSFSRSNAPIAQYGNEFDVSSIARKLGVPASKQAIIGMLANAKTDGQVKAIQEIQNNIPGSRDSNQMAQMLIQSFLSGANGKTENLPVLAIALKNLAGMDPDKVDQLLGIKKK